MVAIYFVCFAYLKVQKNSHSGAAKTYFVAENHAVILTTETAK